MPQKPSHPAPDYSQHPDYAVAALLHMLVRFPMVDCRTMADSITAHLNFVACDTRFSDPVRHAAAQSAGEWEAMIAMRAALARQHHRQM
jgi:hypothetical protein